MNAELYKLWQAINALDERLTKLEERHEKEDEETLEKKEDEK